MPPRWSHLPESGAGAATGGYSADQWSPIWGETYCNWRELAFYDKVEPPSWTIGDLVTEAGYAGILYRSVADPTGTCLVLYPRNSVKFTAPVHDPDQLLPRNADSWRVPP